MKLRRWETQLELLVIPEEADPWSRWGENPVAKKIEEWIDNGTIFNWHLQGDYKHSHGSDFRYRLTLYVRKGKLTMDEAIKGLRKAIDAEKKGA